MDIIKEIVEQNLLSSLLRFKKVLKSAKSHKRVVLDQNGKERVVFVPCKITKMAQRYVLDNYLIDITPHFACFSYLRSKSTVDMVGYHIDNKYFLHLDIKHYFDNMNWDIFIEVLMECFPNSKFYNLLQDNNEQSLKDILLFRGKFRQGSITAPYVSNIYLYKFDCVVNEYIKKVIPNGKYSRYSDDIIISSSQRIDRSIIDYLKEELKKYKLRLNYKKIYFCNVFNHTKLLGLTLTRNHDITIPTSMKKKIKHIVYGVLEKDEKINFNVVFGYLYYLLMCDPIYFNFLQEKYQKNGELMLDRIKAKEKLLKKTNQP